VSSTWGSELQFRGGETSCPSPVCFFGMVAPASKAGLDTSMVTFLLLLERSYLVELSNPTKTYSLTAVPEALRMSISTRLSIH
jgi:hypothetical protein